MRGIHYHAVPGGLRMTGDQLVLMEKLELIGVLLHADHQSYVLHRHRVACRLDRDQGVGSHSAQPHSFVTVGWTASQRREPFAGESIDRPLVGGAVDAQVGNLNAPALKPAVEFLPRSEAPARQRVALNIFNATLDLALGARPIGLAGVRAEAVVAREVLEQRMPHYLVFAAAQHQRAWIIV